MKTYPFYLSLIFIITCLSTPLYAAVFTVSSSGEFGAAQNNAAAGDSIIWKNGLYGNIFMQISKDSLYIGAETLGEVIFRGASRVNVSADYITFRGFQYVGGNIGSNDVINITGSNGHYDEINIRAYRCYKYLRVREESQYVRITHCNFENRLTVADQNILSILVDANQPGYHKIQYCSFKNFPGGGNDEGVEPIRIGLSTQADRNSRSLVEYCYFTQCDGDGEIISSKASQNVYRFNTFEDNLKAELVLRHGSEAIVYGNFFINNKGGVRVREGQNHYIYNNYFTDIWDRPIFLQNEDSDPLDAITIAFNTVMESDDIRLGGPGSNPPTNVIFANNIFTTPQDGIFEEPTGMESWISNIALGTLGINLPASGIAVVDPMLVQNSAGFYGLDSMSPAIDAAQAGYLPLPQFAGMDTVDVDILFDMMGQARPSSVALKDLGSNEYPHNVPIQPIATEANTGPSYETAFHTSIEEPQSMVEDLFQLFPNPASEQINIKIQTENAAEVKVEILDLQGRVLSTVFQDTLLAGEHTISEQIASLPAGSYMLKVQSTAISGGQTKGQARSFSKL
ncbi:MAG: chondroitinase-B domain-containing protein [Bacteroidota bacterium]